MKRWAKTLDLFVYNLIKFRMWQFCFFFLPYFYFHFVLICRLLAIVCVCFYSLFSAFKRCMSNVLYNVSNIYVYLYCTYICFELKKKNTYFLNSLFACICKNWFVVVVFVSMFKKIQKNCTRYCPPDTKRPGDGCGANEWQCDNRECINTEFVCDATNDCTDNSDEERGCANTGKVVVH